MNQNFVDFMKDYKSRHIAIAVSGGADSMALMHWVKELGMGVTILTVDHGLRPESKVEAEHVGKIAKKLGFKAVTLYWTGPKPDKGIEAAAREARYDAMLNYCRENKIDVLLVAHHADDQIETFLMNLGRGSGVYGLAAMRARTIRNGVEIARPLLKVSRKELADYCKKNKIHYFTDAMNEDENFTRVKIRKNRGLLETQLLISDDRILSAIDSLARVRDMLESKVTNLADDILSINPPELKNCRAVFIAETLFDLPEELQLKLLSYLVQKIGGLKYPPRLEQIRVALAKLGRNNKITTGHCTLRRLNDKILIVREGEKASFKQPRKRVNESKI